MNAELTSEFAKLGPWVFQFRIDGAGLRRRHQRDRGCPGRAIFPLRARGRDDPGTRVAGRGAHLYPGATARSKTRARPGRPRVQLAQSPVRSGALAGLKCGICAGEPRAHRPRDVWEIRCRFLFRPDVSPARTVEAHLTTARHRAQSIHLDALRARTQTQGLFSAICEGRSTPKAAPQIRSAACRRQPPGLRWNP